MTDRVIGEQERGDRLEVRVWRGNAHGAFQTFRVPRRDKQTVLDIVTHIQRHLDPTLAYRFACRVGMCGTCAMTVNGRPRWTCRTQARAVVHNGTPLVLEPLRSLPVIRDLVVDMAPFFDKWADARGRFVPRETQQAAGARAARNAEPEGAAQEPARAFARVAPESAERRAADAAIECINCAVCFGACDVVAWRADYLGPAALNRAWAAWNDVRDGARGAVLEAVAREGGCQTCHTHRSCAETCPVGLDPTWSIAGLKRALTRAVLKGDIA